MTAVRMDLTTLFDAITARDLPQVVTEVAKGLLDEVQPSKIAGRLGIAATFGDKTGQAVAALTSAGRIGDWVRVISPGPEPGAERRQLLLPAIPLVNAIMFAAPAIAAGLEQQKLTMPDPLYPKDVTHKDGTWGQLRDSFLANDSQMFARVLMGLYASGTDYREMEGGIYYALNARFGSDGFPLLMLTKATQLLDSVEWGDRVPVVFQWLLPRLFVTSPEVEGGKAVRDFIGDPSQSIDFVRTRLQMSNPAAAGEDLRQRIAGGSASDALNGVMTALKGGATPPQVAVQVAVVAANHLAAMPLEAHKELEAATIALRVANSARLAVTHVQDVRVQPILFHAANLVNQTIRGTTVKRVQPTPSSTSSPLVGGLIEYSVLRNVQRQLQNGDESGARSTIRRYAQMAFSGRSLAGTLGLAATRVDLADDHNGRTLQALQSAGEEYLTLSAQQQTTLGAQFMEAVAHLIATQHGNQAQTQQIEQLTGTANQE